MEPKRCLSLIGSSFRSAADPSFPNSASGEAEKQDNFCDVPLLLLSPLSINQLLSPL